MSSIPRGHARSLAAYPHARCLDGSPAQYYVSETKNSQGIFIFFQGGGFCADHSDCQSRTQTPMGSTTYDQPTMQLKQPYFSRVPAANPLLSSFTFVFVRYCDGGYFSGERMRAVVHNGTRMHFAGRWITEAVLSEFHSRLEAASRVVLGGCSAGGIHVLAHLDAMRTMLPSRVQIAGFVDSGFYPDIPSFTARKRFVISPSGHNASGLLGRACLAAHPRRHERCLSAERSAPFLKTRAFIWQSLYDVDQPRDEAKPGCKARRWCKDEYARNFSHAIQTALFDAPRVRHGAFLDNCERHCEYALALHPTLNVSVDGLTPLHAFSAWWHREQLNSSARPRTLWKASGGKVNCKPQAHGHQRHDKRPPRVRIAGAGGATAGGRRST